MSADGGLWYVKLADGDVEPMTLDDLDEAYNADRVDEDTMVLPSGELQWQRLGALLGLDPEPARRTGYAPAPALSSPPPAMPVSLRPVSVDLGADLDLDSASPFKSRSRKPLYGGIAGAAVLAVVAFVATRGGASSPAVAAAAAPTPPPVVAAAAPPPQAAAAAAEPATPPAPPPETRFTASQRNKLAAADKALSDKAAARKKAKGAAVSHAQPKYKSQGFTSNGSKFDPLNSAQ